MLNDGTSSNASNMGFDDEDMGLETGRAADKMGEMNFDLGSDAQLNNVGSS